MAAEDMKQGDLSRDTGPALKAGKLSFCQREVVHGRRLHSKVGKAIWAGFPFLESGPQAPLEAKQQRATKWYQASVLALK